MNLYSDTDTDRVGTGGLTSGDDGPRRLPLRIKVMHRLGPDVVDAPHCGGVYSAHDMEGVAHEGSLQVLCV
jgi:hypothetical protein